ncbi:hypothetical protein [Nonomuraea sp. NPDC049695]|uniref:hypothetical protein n=1 Tax=Nonomuraea sp. NPDC049695 TaxID=3154734 RepID=UPI00342942E1
MSGQGAVLSDFVRTSGPLHGQALHHLALACASAVAKLHARGNVGLGLSHESVALGLNGQVLIGWQPGITPGSATDDMRAWADLVVFAGTGRTDGDTAALPPALRLAVRQCRRPDPTTRPRAADVLRVLLGQSVAAAVASVDDLLAS